MANGQQSEASWRAYFYQACEGLCYKERNTDHLQAQPAYQLMRRLQIAAAIADSLYLEREF